ncbi:MAG TPA: YggS family pyridoxal phosphate-dependent enzyme [Bacteroidia bacterium]|jgi:hypothetical protein|nr:YggS family pyridoxal phosphate-dependent enzyme [Bacteroidia bacterium]
MAIKDNLLKITSTLPSTVTLVAVTKTHPVQKLEELYQAGHNVFGENKVQEMVEKYEALPKDIQWHLIGHLQTNKVKFIAPFVHLIHSVDSLKLLQEINKQAQKNNRVIDCLLQVYIAKEETKFGLDMSEVEQLLASGSINELKNIRIRGLMGMASNTSNTAQIAAEFKSLADFFHQHKTTATNNLKFEVLSMGMSSDYEIAIRNGSTLIRVGSLIFGNRA